LSVTINDVARCAGVSITTVSRVINNGPSVKPSTREKVTKIVNELGFQPNLSARNMGGAKSYVLGYIYDNPNTHYVIGMQNGILDACREHDYGLMIHPCDSKSETVIDDFKKMITQSRISGIILTPPFSERSDFISALTEMDVEFICIVSGKNHLKDNSQLVIINDWISAYNITSHLIEFGHKRIAFLAGEKRHASTNERLEGYIAALKHHNITVNQNIIIQGEYSFESGHKRAEKLLASSHKITAIIGCNDEIAAGAQHAARCLGISMPEKLSIAGFEDSPYSKQATPKLTTVRQSNAIISKFATDLLINRIRPKKPTKKPIIKSDSFKDNIYTPELILRPSTAKIPAI
jgi:LacI family transcriptional regulator